MSRETVQSLVTCCALIAAPSICRAQVPPFKDQVVTPEKLGLPKGNVRSSEPVQRVYRTDDNDKILPGDKQPKGYPFTPQLEYQLKPNEKLRPHYGVDVTTRREGKQSSEPMDYKAGVHGTVTQVGDDPTNPITVKLPDGTTITYRHSSKTYVKPGDKVTPDTVIGMSGDKGARKGAYHVHIEARDKNGKYMHPDQAFQAGERKPTRSASKSDLGGVLVSPVPKKEDKPLEAGETNKMLEKRPEGTPAKWPIKLPKESRDHEKDK